ncbi:hypothetical protein JNUCC0626_20960 [Lentzea sp. JNUCC 0626]|uniref:hypothetical protein n=1 Tax=Lentzea sp. JNUCC 0626 TaxID=3367513 RepID=UPI0037482A04
MITTTMGSRDVGVRVGAEIVVGDPSRTALVLLFVASAVLALIRLRDVLGPGRRGRRLSVLDVAVAVVLVFASVSDLVAGLAAPVVVVAGLIAGLAGMATTGLAALIMATVGGGDPPVTTWFVTPLLLGLALRNVLLKPEVPVPLLVEFSRDAKRLRMMPRGGDVFWGAAARLVCVVPLVFVFLVPAPGVDPRARIVGAVTMWGTLLLADRARRSLLLSHRKAARTTDVALFLVLLAIAAGPAGAALSRWWQAHASGSEVPLILVVLGVLLLEKVGRPRFARWRVSWLRVWLSRVLVGLPQLTMICTALPFLVGGVFHPAGDLLGPAVGVALLGLAHVAFSGWNGDGFHRQAADVVTLVRATPDVRDLLLAGWLNDTLYRRRTWRMPTWQYTTLPRLAVVLAELGAESAHSTAPVHVALPWGGAARLDHRLSPGLLRLAGQMLDLASDAYPTQMRTAGTLGHLTQQTARADLAARRAVVALYLDDFEGAVAAARQSADHYTEINARAHAATELIHTANRLSSTGQHTAAAALLADVPDELPPPVRRLSLVVRAAAAHRVSRDAAARTLLATARAIPDRSVVAFRRAFLVERVRFPSCGEGAHKAMVLAERELDRALGPAVHR